MESCVDCKRTIGPLHDRRSRPIVLSLDGGGVRGLFQARILQRISQDFDVCLCSIFDMVVGTSIGGVIALTIAQANKRSVSKYINNFFDARLMQRIANKSLLDDLLDVFKFSPLYDGKGKAEVFDEQFYPCSIGELGLPCIVTAYDVKKCKPKLFCSWRDQDNSIGTSTLADLATSPPVYFPPIKIGDTYFMDGGVAVNNPASVANNVGGDFFPLQEIKILSIGTGIYKEKWNEENLQNWGGLNWLYHGVLDLLMEAPGQAVNTVLEEKLRERFLRIDSDDIADIRLDDSSDESIRRIIASADKIFDREKDRIKEFTIGTQ